MIPPWLGLLGRAAVAAAFLVSGFSKAGAPAEEFAVVIGAYQILPDGMVMTAAAFLPWLELFLGFALLFGFSTGLSSRAAMGLLGAFILAILSTKARGFQLPNCGCFGNGIHLSAWQAVSLDALLLSLAYAGYKKGADILSLDKWIEAGL